MDREDNLTEHKAEIKNVENVEKVEFVQADRRTQSVGVRIHTELTAEEILALKEMARDRIAISRSWGKVKNGLLALAAVVAAYLLLIEAFGSWLASYVVK